MAAGEHTVVSNRRARHDYEILERVEAGISLRGSEVKSVRANGLAFRDSYVEYKDGEMFLVGCHIGPYSHSNIQNHSEGRERKLLLHKREIRRLIGAVERQGLTLVPLELYFRRGKVKVVLGLGRGKKLYDKRADEKKRDDERDMQRAVRSR